MAYEINMPGQLTKAIRVVRANLADAVLTDITQPAHSPSGQFADLAESGPSPGAVTDEVEQLRWIENADAVVDAQSALEEKDLALLAVLDYTWTIPGVAEIDKFAYRDKYGMRTIEGTSDMVMSTEHGRLIDLAATYAQTYNQYVLRHAEKL